MIRANPNNINTAEYWNDIYGSFEKRDDYRKNEKGISSKDTTNRFLEALKMIKDGDRVLDIGCGIGTFTTLVKKTYPKCEVWGVDISDKVIEDNLLEHKDINYLAGKVGEIHAPIDGFDVVFSGETLEHLDDPNALFRDASKCLKSGGTFVISTPLLNAIDLDEHVWFFTHDDLAQFFTANGFQDVAFMKLPDREHELIIYGKGVKG